MKKILTIIYIVWFMLALSYIIPKVAEIKVRIEQRYEEVEKILEGDYND